MQQYELAPYATKASQSLGRLIPEPLSLNRTEFQRDRDRIIHSNAFRKMRNKTQVFIESEGDYYRTRLTHSLEVAQIARSISRALHLDEDLAETIALAHDLGHTCFGHAGENGLADAMKPYGGFNHNEQTFRVLVKLENRYARFDGMNLTWETLEGIAKHNGPVSVADAPPTIRDFSARWDLELASYAGAEAQVAALSDDIAYNTHDMDDGHHAGLFSLDDLKELPLFGGALAKMRGLYPGAANERLMYEAVREVIGIMIEDVLSATKRNIEIISPKSAKDIRSAAIAAVSFSPQMSANIRILQDFLRSHMYRHHNVNRVCVKAKRVVRELFDYFMENPDCLPASWFEVIKSRGEESHKARTVADYIAGMTDRFAAQEHQRLFSAGGMF